MSRWLCGLLVMLLGLPVTSCGGGAAGPSATPPPAHSFRNPVLGADFPDPMVLRVGDTYFAYATGSSTERIQVARSHDLVHWTQLGDALPQLPPWQSIELGKTWAPDVSMISGRFVMYYVGRAQTPDQQCISVATAQQPQGPFVDRTAVPLVCQHELGGSIDPSRFVDADGVAYLLWKNDGNCCGMPTKLWGGRLSPEGVSLTSSATWLGISNDATWEGGVVEAPFLVRRGTQYYLFYSGNDYASTAYAVGYATADRVLGPYTEAAANPILRSAGQAAGPGGQSVIADSAGQLWMVYHAWAPGAIGVGQSRSMWIDRLHLGGDRATVDGPTSDWQGLPG